MLPLHADDKPFKAGFRIQERISGWIRLIFADKSSKNLFLFLLLNLTMAFVELLYGIWTNSLGLISDSFHMFFDCTALVAGLAASIIARWRSNDKYPYGYVRAEVLAGFVNGLFLLFIAFFIFSEAVERTFEPPEVHHDRLFLISVLGFIVNLIGIFVFQHGGAHHGHSHGGGGHNHSHGGHNHSHGGHSHSHGGHNHSHGGHGHSHGGQEHSHEDHCNEVEEKHSQSKIFQGASEQKELPPRSPIPIYLGVGIGAFVNLCVFLHIMADTLGSVGVIISSILIHYFGWMIADPICSIFISVLIGLSVFPLLGESSAILMQRQPKELDHLLPGCFTKVSQLEGVYSVQEPHFWTLCSDVYVGALKLEAAPGADHKYLLSQTHNIFTAVGVRQLYVQIDTALI